MNDNDLREARRLMSLIADQAASVGPVDANTVIQMAKVWAHIALAEEAKLQTTQLTRIADALESANRMKGNHAP